MMAKDRGSDPPEIEIDEGPAWAVRTDVITPGQALKPNRTLPFTKGTPASAPPPPVHRSKPPPPPVSPWAGSPRVQEDPTPQVDAVTTRRSEAPGAMPFAPATRPPPPSTPRQAASPLALLWFAEHQVDRIRGDAQWSRLVDAVEAEAPADALLGASRADEDRRDVREVLRRGAPCNAAELRQRVAELDPSSVLALLEGDLVLSYEPARELRAKLELARALAHDDETVAAAVARGEALLGVASFVNTPIADEVARQVDQALRRAVPTLPRDYLADEARRVVVLGRHYERRELFGASQLVASLRLSERQSVVCYLDAALKDILPLYPVLQVRMLTELHPRLDEYSSGAMALRCLALAWRPPRMGL
jgi:hypothetical protein